MISVPRDAQSRAYREMDSWERYADIELGAHGEAEHPPATGLDGIRLPEQYEAAMWDAGRQPPPTPGEARVQLAERIADPAAPDGPESAGAYDHLED
ncbi:hypothetical protein [Pseudonocardia asaccharolytica]|uniref:Uncharacterized protein n=1 Tax=Pseudonocardia asaccharolytica DSM 44247 = NBRC 16224 TaxID=1123024 RepID=A0A511D7R0_9PSEU|nr:hypothetical protein [Pseudonocardia asaccharolytica]GEL20849.1 hypothetical protein PA7_46860 [Pseudonocardia asaccharolytica DSM 44247 = NBRC 16224]